MAAKSRSYFNCSVFGCMNSTLNSEYSFFSLPEMGERRNIWLKLIQREDLIDKISYHCKVCEAHFDTDCIITNKNRKQLKKFSIPRLKLPNKEIQATVISTDTNTQNDAFQPNVNVQSDAAFQSDMELQTSSSILKRKLINEIPDDEKKKLKPPNIIREPEIFFDLCDKFLSNNLASIVKEQAKLKFNSIGKRHSLKYKMFCLNLFNLSPQAYSLLKDTLCLPSEIKLKRMYLPITKIDSHLMEIFKTKVGQLPDKDRNCSLVIDVINIKTHLCYNIKDDKIYGFHDINGEQSTTPAKYALVAMVQGIFENYQQLAGYAFLAECKNSLSISEWTQRLIQKLFAIGLNIRVLISNIGSEGILNSARNRAVSTERPYFYVGGRKIFYIFDAPNLIKSVRNNLKAYDFHFENNVAKWDHIQQFYERDKTKQSRIAAKLTDSHMSPSNLEKTKLKYAVQVLSSTVAAGISVYRDFGAMEPSSKGTVELITKMSNLFDFLNSSSSYGRNKYQKAFYGEEYQKAFIKEMLNFFASLKLVNRKNSQDVTSKVKFVKGFQITLKSILLLHEDLRMEGYNQLLTRKLNQNCLQNFFIRVKRENGNATKPTSWQLVSVFRKIFLIGILKSSTKPNCTDDLTKILLEGKEFEASLALASVKGDTENTSTMLQKTIKPEKSEDSKPRIPRILNTDYNTLHLPDKNALVYISGHLLKKCFAIHKDCDIFKCYIQEENPQNLPYDIRYNRYNNYCKEGGHILLIAPQDDFVQFVQLIEAKFYLFFKSNNRSCEILERLSEDVKDVTFATPCACFPVAYCKKLYLRMRIYYTLKCNNRAFQQCHKIFSVKCLYKTEQ